VRIAKYVRCVPDHGGDQQQQSISPFAKVIFNVVSKYEEEIHIAQQVEDIAVQEE
jgi:hypothetical protein